MDSETEDLFVSNLTETQFTDLVDLVLAKSKHGTDNVLLSQLSGLVGYLNVFCKHKITSNKFFTLDVVNKLFLAIEHLVSGYIASKNPDSMFLIIKLYLAIANGMLINQNVFDEFSLLTMYDAHSILMNLVYITDECLAMNDTPYIDQKNNLRYSIAPARLMFLILYKYKKEYLEIKSFRPLLIKYVNLAFENIKNILWVYFKSDNVSLNEPVLIELLKAAVVIFQNYGSIFQRTPAKNHSFSGTSTINNSNTNSFIATDSTTSSNGNRSEKKSSLDGSKKGKLSSLHAKLQPIFQNIHDEIFINKELAGERKSFLSELSSEDTVHRNSGYINTDEAKQLKNDALKSFLTDDQQLDYESLHVSLIFFAKLVSLDTKFKMNRPETSITIEESHPTELWQTKVDVSVRLYRSLGWLFLMLPYEFYEELFFTNQYKKSLESFSIMGTLFEYYSIKPCKIIQIILFAFFSIVSQSLSKSKETDKTSGSAAVTKLSGKDAGEENINMFLSIINHMIKLKNKFRQESNELKKEIYNNSYLYKKTKVSRPSIDNIQFEKSLEYYQKFNFVDEMTNFFESFLLPTTDTGTNLVLNCFATRHSLKQIMEEEPLTTAPQKDTTLKVDHDIKKNRVTKKISNNDTYDPNQSTKKKSPTKVKALRKSKSTGFVKTLKMAINPEFEAKKLSMELPVNTPERSTKRNDQFFSNPSPTLNELHPKKSMKLTPRKSLSNLYNKYSHLGHSKSFSKGRIETASFSEPNVDSKKHFKSEFRSNLTQQHDLVAKNNLATNTPRTPRTPRSPQGEQQRIVNSPMRKANDDINAARKKIKRERKELLAIINCVNESDFDVSRQLSKVSGMSSGSNTNESHVNNLNGRLHYEIAVKANCYQCLLKSCKNPFLHNNRKNLILEIYFNLITEHFEDQETPSDHDNLKASAGAKPGRSKKLNFNADTRYSSRSTRSNSESTLRRLAQDTNPVESPVSPNFSNFNSFGIDEKEKSLESSANKLTTINDFFLRFQNLKNLQKFLVIFLGNDLFYLIFMFFQQNSININEQELRIITEHLHSSRKNKEKIEEKFGTSTESHIDNSNFNFNNNSDAIAATSSTGTASTVNTTKSSFPNSGPSSGSREMSVVSNLNMNEADMLYDKELGADKGFGNFETIDWDLYRVSEDDGEFVSSKQSDTLMTNGSGFGSITNAGSGTSAGTITGPSGMSSASHSGSISAASEKTQRTLSKFSFMSKTSESETTRSRSNFGSIARSFLAVRKKDSVGGISSKSQDSTGAGFSNSAVYSGKIIPPDPQLMKKFENYEFGSRPANSGVNPAAESSIDPMVVSDERVQARELNNFSSGKANSDGALRPRQNSTSGSETKEVIFARKALADIKEGASEHSVSPSPEHARYSKNVSRNSAYSMSASEKIEEAEKLFTLIEKLSKK